MVSKKENLKNKRIKYSAVIFVCDITDRNSFDELESWIQNVENMRKSLPKIIVGTNLENFIKEEVDEDEVEVFAKQKNVPSYLIDTNNAPLIEKLFTYILSNVFGIEGSIQNKDSSSNYKATTKSKKGEDKHSNYKATSKSKKGEDKQAELIEVILLGEKNSGTNNIITTYLDSHNSEYQNNCGYIKIKVRNKLVNLKIKEGSYIKERNKILSQNSSAMAFVYNTNDKKTFNELNGWFKEMDKIKPGAPKAIIGNLGKIENEEVTEEELENLAKNNNIKFYKVVNKENIRVLDQLFINIVEEVLQKRQSANYGENENDENDGETKDNKKEGKCCCLIV